MVINKKPSIKEGAVRKVEPIRQGMGLWFLASWGTKIGSERGFEGGNHVILQVISLVAQANARSLDARIQLGSI